MNGELKPELARVIEAGLLNHVGKQNAIKSKAIIAALKSKGYDITGPQLREYVHHLRVDKGLFIAADTNGYYMASNEIERVNEIRSMKSRIKKMQKVVDRLTKEMSVSENQKTLF